MTRLTCFRKTWRSLVVLLSLYLMILFTLESPALTACMTTCFLCNSLTCPARFLISWVCKKRKCLHVASALTKKMYSVGYENLNWITIMYDYSGRQTSLLNHAVWFITSRKNYRVCRLWIRSKAWDCRVQRTVLLWTISFIISQSCFTSPSSPSFLSFSLWTHCIGISILLLASLL